MGIFKYLKSLFKKEETKDESVNEQRELVDTLETEGQWLRFINSNSVENDISNKDINEQLKTLRRRKYTDSNFNLANRLECEVLNYLLGNECNCFNVYWNLYVPYSQNRYMQIDHLVVTGDTIYSIECKDYKTCTSIEVFAEHWECYYSSGHYKNVNGVSQNAKHLSVLKKYLNDSSLEFKSIVVLVVADDFEGYIPDNEVILVREKEFELIFKLLDRKLKFNCDENMNQNFVELNKKIYECMNSSEEVVNTHKAYIEERYK
ncbi:MAG: nuclease-related domain-containing protein [Sarcina sp.]